MGIAKLGSLSFRIDPSNISYAYQVDYVTIDTIGGQVIQVLGATIGDITIQGQFGEDHATKRESWQMAESFHASIRALIDQQALPGKITNSTGVGVGQVHNPITFSFNDGVHNWNMKVLIKGMDDANGTGSIEHKAGKFSYGYKLTLFLVEDSTLAIQKVTTDAFISRISAGLGWKSSAFNGSQTLAEAIKFIQNNSTDGTYEGYILSLLGQDPKTGNPVVTGQTQGTGRAAV